MQNTTSKLCGKMIRRLGMPEARPCLREWNHRGSHTPDLTNLKEAFGLKEILHLASDYINPTSEHRSTRWVAIDKFDDKRIISANHLLSGDFSGKRPLYLKGRGGFDKNGKIYPEYVSVKSHYERNLKADVYKQMVFFDAWDPDKEGSLIVGGQWIRQHLGPKPSPHHQLHVLKTKKYPYGFFGPGGIVWRRRMDRHDQDTLDLIAEWSDKKWKEFIEAENVRRKND